jgi:hypothetical protein
MPSPSVQPESLLGRCGSSLLRGVAGTLRTGERALPCTPELPPARRRLDAVCAPGYRGRKRGEVVRTRTTALQMHTRQWIGTYAGRGNGNSSDELTSALQAITTYLKHFALTPQKALVRLHGQYGDAAVIAQIILTGAYLLTRGRGYQLLEYPQRKPHPGSFTYGKRHRKPHRSDC